MKKFKQVFILELTTLILFFSVTSVNANEKRSTKVVYELFKVMEMPVTYQESIEKMLEVQIKQNPSIAPLKDTMLKFFNKYMGWESMKEDMAKIYMKNFTDEELKELIIFHKTPVGRKTAMLMPVLTSEGAALGQKRVQENMHELQMMIKEKMSEPQKNPSEN
ncbi:MAG: DUF2059 domain-containing protein [Victivallales bacterium]|nr:DUF2059 domain-containing protein [Victivallales bacterium]